MDFQPFTSIHRPCEGFAVNPSQVFRRCEGFVVNPSQAFTGVKALKYKAFTLETYGNQRKTCAL
ncbi:MAG: hypothetical protein MR971_08050 [Bacteroidales bacterium]|nr:hypothetical protein [Bacteroidales bacterium]